MVFRLAWSVPMMCVLAACATRPSLLNEPQAHEDFEGLCALTTKPLRNPKVTQPSPSSDVSDEKLMLSTPSQAIAGTMGVLDLLRVILSLEHRRTGGLIVAGPPTAGPAVSTSGRVARGWRG